MRVPPRNATVLLYHMAIGEINGKKKRTGLGPVRVAWLWEPCDTNYFFAAFFAGFLAGAFLAGAFFAGAFLAGALAQHAFFAHAFFAGAFLAGAFLAGAFFAGAFFAVAISFVLLVLSAVGTHDFVRNIRGYT